MKKRISFRHLLLATVAVFIFSKAGDADPLTITIGPGVNTFVFQSQVVDQSAFEFSVFLRGNQPPGIAGGFGGESFPDEPSLIGPLPGGGFRRISYFGPPGVPPEGTYTHSFVGWPVGTMLDVAFHYRFGGRVIVIVDPILIQQTTNATNVSQAQTRPVPEPTTLLLLGTGLAGIAIKTRKRLKTCQGRQ